MNIVFHVGYSKEPWDNDTPALGGTEQCVNKLGMEMAIKGHNVFIVGEVNQVSPQKNIKYIPLSNMQLLPEDIDVLIGVSYLHFYKHYNCSKIKKILFWLHNEEPFYWFKGQKMSESEINKAYDLCDNIICLTDWHKQHVLTYNPRIEEKIKIIGNGISLKERKRGTYKVPGSYLYSSHAERGLDKLLNEWPSIKEKRPYATLAIATPAYGLEYYNEHFSKKVKSLEHRNVSFLGPLSTDALYNRMKTTETWYYPTDYKETYCVTALEMMAHGVIVDTNEIAGLKETVNGFNKSTDWERIDKYIQTRDWKNVSEDWYNLIETKMQTVVNDADMTYVICLDVDEQKKKEITDRFESFGFNSPLTIWNACNGYTGEYMPDTYTVCKHWKLKDQPNHFWTRNVTDGEIGCAASHYTIWLDAQKKKYDKILILEEDFEVKRKFDPSEIETNHPWTLMYLGCIFQEPPSDFNDKLCKPNYTYQTHAYMLTGNGVRLLLEQQFQNYFFAVDEFLPATYCDHPRGDLGYVTQDTIALAVKEDFLIQSERSSTTEPRVFSLSDYSYKAFVRRFIHESAKTKQWDLICDENIPDVFSYPLFTQEFCSLVIEEANNLNEWTKERHDNYPTTDILLESIGLDKIYSQVLREFVYPCAIHKWKLEGGPWPDLSSENFMIKYDEDVQGHLALHHDAGLISCVLTLNKDFEGGGTWFWRQQKVHKGNIGEISIHPAKITHRHGGRPISKGERYIIVSFCSKP
jgi:GR25 family glycosyltransferase involved in LPS biosynthesis/glycosyltransferase involved in cell wall biosynthesis